MPITTIEVAKAKINNFAAVATRHSLVVWEINVPINYEINFR